VKLISHHRETDFDRFALAGPSVEAFDRSLLVTIDFEAFNHVSSFDLWLAALERWAHHSLRQNWGFSVFIALEDVVQLRHLRPDRYREFLEAAKMLNRSGAEFYPHNHGVFDARTGEQVEVRPQHIPSYTKRASFFYDVVRRHRLDLQDWFKRLLTHYDEFLTQANIPKPKRMAFRAGGWDHGATREENSVYIDAVCDAGFAYDSSVTRGTFGTKDYRLGAPFGSNIFELKGSLTEVAPCWSYDCGMDAVSRTSLGALRQLVGQPQVWVSRRPRGAFVVVLHFDHLFRPDSRMGSGPSLSTVNRRVDRIFKVMTWLKRSLRFSQATTFEQLALSRVAELPWGYQ
jgi:hypothetical protein